jgi:hypothetical protein
MTVLLLNLIPRHEKGSYVVKGPLSVAWVWPGYTKSCLTVLQYNFTGDKYTARLIGK